MVWRCPPLHLPNWNNLWKWKTEMNKPVAWYKKDSNDYLIENIGQPDFQVQEFIDAGYIPLYTNPADLTDEEIVDLCVKELEKLIAPIEPDYDPWQWNDTIERAILKVQSVKAILRKAQSNCNGFCGKYECKENKEGCKRNE